MNRRGVALPGSFLLTVGLLSLAAVLMGPLAGWLDVRHAKAALRLVKPLDALSVEALLPYRVVERSVLDPTVVEALGTDLYLHWILEDSGVPPGDPLRFCQLFVTYDTGGHNLVPHTPDECRLGAGYQPAQAHENLEVVAAGLAPAETRVPVRVCTFVKTAVFQREQSTVIYTFFCNGRFVSTRNAVRLLINNPTDRHAFFSKVEVSFPRATREQSIEGTSKLFDRLLPILMKDHYPDFEAAEAQGTSPS